MSQPQSPYVQGHPPPPPYPPATPQVSPRRKAQFSPVFWGLITVVVGIALFAVFSGPIKSFAHGLFDGASSGGPVGAVGQPVRDGKLEFVVKGASCGHASAGGRTAQGQYCLVELTVANIGDKPATFSGGNQKGSSQGAEYKDDSAVYTTINPGNSVAATLAFDVPRDGTLRSVTLHDSAFSGGVVVRF